MMHTLQILSIFSITVKKTQHNIQKILYQLYIKNQHFFSLRRAPSNMHMFRLDSASQFFFV